MADPSRFRIGAFTYGADGRVVDWGTPNDRYLPHRDGDPWPYFVPSWTVLGVRVWVHFPSGERWTPLGIFFCGEWSSIPFVFERFWSTAGFYARVSFCVEGFEWTWEDGWMNEDHI